MENLSIKGIWFVPEDNKKSVAGELTFSMNKGILLTLIGALAKSFQQTHNPQIIHGLSEKGDRITLYTCERIGASYNSASFETAKYSADFMFIGRDWLTVDTLHFSLIGCLYEDIQIWFGTSGVTWPSLNDGPFKLEYNPPPAIRLNITDDMQFAIRHDFDAGPFNRSNTTELIEKCRLDIVVRQPMHFKELLKQFQTLNSLMTISYFQRPLINSLVVKQNDGSGETRVYFKTDMYPDIYTERRSKQFFLFTYSEVENSFENIIKTWFQVQEKMSPAYGGLVESFMAYDHILEFSFLNLAQALETFHRRSTHKMEKDEEYKKKWKRVIETTDEEYRNWLKQELAYSHEPKFVQRLMELADSVPQQIKVVLFKPDANIFLQQIKHSRNYYTHYNPDLHEKALHNDDLFLLTERMKVFLICSVFQQLNFAKEEITKIILSKSTLLFNHVIDHNELSAAKKQGSPQN